jgi:hypothetical protein
MYRMYDLWSDTCPGPDVSRQISCCLWHFTENINPTSDLDDGRCQPLQRQPLADMGRFLMNGGWAIPTSMIYVTRNRLRALTCSRHVLDPAELLSRVV